MTSMSFGTDHIESRLDSLAINNHSNTNNNGNDETIYNNNNNKTPVISPSSSFNANMKTSPTNSGGSRQYQYHNLKPKTSLLSSSLANERKSNQTIGFNVGMGLGFLALNNNSNTSPSSTNSNHSSMLTSPLNKNTFSIDEGLSDHPEPELLASSVGKEVDGRLIPSSSTISLLSLNNNSGANKSNNDQQSYLPSPKGDFSNQLQFHNQITQHPQPQAFIDRKNSYNNIASRNSITHLNQIRLQPYQKFTSPPPIQQSVPQHQQNDFISFQPHDTFSQSIPINNKSNNPLIVPDSPNLDPTSLGGSPSRFWLSSQTPPRSLAGSFSRNSRTQLSQMLQQFHNQPHNQQNQIYFQQFYRTQSPMPNSNNNAKNFTFTANAKAIDIERQNGDVSPSLNPVQTPSEDPPMTPLYLNANGHDSKAEATGYFDSVRLEATPSNDQDESSSDDEVESNGHSETKVRPDVIMN